MAATVLLEQRHESLVSPQPCVHYVSSVLKLRGELELDYVPGLQTEQSYNLWNTEVIE